MDDLASAACGAWRTLYNQFASKEEIFREMLLNVSDQLEDAFLLGVETQGDVEDVLRLVARMILELHKPWNTSGFLRMVVADSRQFPWMPRSSPPSWSLKRAARAISPFDCDGHPGLPQSDAAAHQFMGMLCGLDDGSRARTRS
jgi:TetR/AcrR family transcriptional regulator, regulator of autoinduction and epiphytic fitness